jgi:hypothetical protein
MVGKEAAILVENGELGEENAERVLDDASVLDLQNLREIRGADFLDGATNAMFNDCMKWSDRVWMKILGKDLRREPLMSRPILKNYNFWINKVSDGNSILSTYPSNDDKPVVKVETNAQDMSGEQAQTKEESREQDGNNGSNDQLMSATAVVQGLFDRRIGSRHGARSFL